MGLLTTLLEHVEIFVTIKPLPKPTETQQLQHVSKYVLWDILLKIQPTNVY